MTEVPAHQEGAITDMEVPVIVSLMHTKKIPLVAGVIRAEALVDRHVIPHRDFRTKMGYQREVSRERVNRLLSDLINNRVDLPTAILLNLRDYKPDLHIAERDGKTYFRLGREKLYVVDGQHRVAALVRLAQEVSPERWAGFEIPFVCMLGASEREEMEQFYIVNSTAKSVRTDLALDLLKQRAESDPAVMKALTERGEAWKVHAQVITELLARIPVWKGRIRFPGEPKEDTTVASTGIVSSLKSLLGTPYFGSITQENQLKILQAYWQGIKQILPEPFDRPTEYSLQKSTGVMIIHTLLMSVLEYLRSKGKSVIEPDSYAQTLKDPLLRLQGDTSSGDVVEGANFWRSGPEGAAGSFSSNAGRRVLVAKIRSLLPPIEVDI